MKKRLAKKPTAAPAPVQQPPVEPVQATEESKQDKDNQNDEDDGSVGEEDMIIVDKSADQENLPQVRPVLKNKSKKKKKKASNKVKDSNDVIQAAEPVQMMQSLPSSTSNQNEAQTTDESSQSDPAPFATTTVDSTVDNSAAQFLPGKDSAQIVIGVAIAAFVVIGAAVYLIKRFTKSTSRKSVPSEKNLA